MENKDRKQIMSQIWLRGRKYVMGGVAFIAVIAGAVLAFRSCLSGNGEPLVQIVENKTIDAGSEEIRAIRDIGQWEFLSVGTEELAELHESHFLGDKHLVRIYEGTLRIGIDMGKASDDWFTRDGSKAVLRLPDVALLDNNFIDEARSRAFYEKGTWDARSREKLYQQAKQKMLKRCLTERNLNLAREKATAEFTRIFKALGFEEVEISFA